MVHYDIAVSTLSSPSALSVADIQPREGLKPQCVVHWQMCISARLLLAGSP